MDWISRAQIVGHVSTKGGSDFECSLPLAANTKTPSKEEKIPLILTAFLMFIDQCSAAAACAPHK